jgi:hypothetical protein
MTRIIDRTNRAPLDRAGHARAATAWRPLHDWLAERHGDRAVRSRLHDAADELIYHDHDPSNLNHRSLLDFAAEAVDRLDGDPTRHPRSRSDLDFLDVGLRARRQAGVRSRAFTLSLIVLVLAAGMMAVLVFQANQNVNQRREIAVYWQLTSENEDLGRIDPANGRLKSLAAWRSHPSANARYSMLAAGSGVGVAGVIGHMVDVFSVMFSPDGKTLASGSGDGSVRLWDVATQRLAGSPLTGRTDGVNSVAFSPDGKTLASGSGDDSVRLWDVVAQRLAGSPLSGHTEVVTSVAFSPDGKTLASGSFDGSVRLWDVTTQRPVGEPLTGHAGAVVSVAFNRDGKTLASGSFDGLVALWDVDTQRPVGSPFAGHTDGVNSVAFSPDGKTLASGSSDKSVRLWDVTTQRPAGDPLTGHTDSVNSVAFSPDGKTLASGSGDDSVRLWDVATHRLVGSPLTDAI